MVKRLLAVVLCVCLLIPFASMAGLQVVAEETEETEHPYILQKIGLRFLNNLTLTNAGIFVSRGVTFDPIDIKNDYDNDLDRIAVQLDTYVDGDEKFIAYMTSGLMQGQFEVSSSGKCDVEERGLDSGRALTFTPGEWLRVTIPLSQFNTKTGGEFNPENFNYFRIYMAEKAGVDLIGGKGTLKLCNICIVDTAQEPPSEKELPIGDGTFRTEPPVYRKMEIGAAYEQTEAVFAGYNLKEYIATHPDVRLYNEDGEKDYTPVITSLLQGLAAAGGGALFIPAGEWDCRSELVMPDGTSIIGEWTNPDESAAARGTILKVYCGRGETEGTPFITMGAHSMVQNLSFWYPEQTVEGIPYPPTIDLEQYTFAKNITLYNSYFGIRALTTANCPNAWNIYGTPLSIGVDFDKVVDVARIEEIHFAADYWINSGLEGAPTSEADVAALKSLLYSYGIGITIRRMDWSYVTYSEIKGYNIGLLFDKSVDGSYPNGQCVGLRFINCQYGHFLYGVMFTSEAMLDITMKNCEYGVYITGKTSGMLAYHNANIHATKYAVFHSNPLVQFHMLASTVSGGRVYTEKGNTILINNKFLTDAPQVELSYGTVSGILLGNTDAFGEEIEYYNPGACTVNYDAAKVDLDTYVPMTREEAAAPIVGPTGDRVVIPDDLDTEGETDVTEQLQTYLTALGEQGGGTLFLRPGKYRINGTFTIPSGVELRGSADYATIPRAINTVFQIYTPIEEGEDEYTTAATVTMEEASGMRGVIFNYPIQNATYRKVDTVLDPVATAESGVDTFVDYYEFDFTPYPFTVRGTGADIYLKNVTIRNGWNGVDFMTYRCDRHMIDYLAGHFFNRGIVVGNGSTGGYIRNYQLNYNSIYTNSERWGGFGGVPSNAEERSWFHQPMQAQFANYSIVLELGHVEDQLVYNCFNYASFIGVHLIGEESGAAEARIYGHGVDYGTVPVMVEEAEDVTFTNMQLTAFNSAGDNMNTERWAVDQEKQPIYAIWLKDTFEGEITVFNYLEWTRDSANPPNASVRVDSGRLNMYNPMYAHRETPLFEVNGDGEFCVVGLSAPLVHSGTEIPPLAAGDKTENLHITAGYAHGNIDHWDGIGNLRYVHARETEHEVPKNVVFTSDSEVVLAESFDTYNKNQFTADSLYQVDNAKYVTIRRGAVRLRMDARSLVLGLKAGQNKSQDMPFALESGRPNSLYRLEWRFTLDEMRNTEDSAVYLYLSNADTKNQAVATIKKDGTIYDAYGRAFGHVALETYYRLAVEVDARDANNKIATVYLLDDNSRVIGKSTTAKMADIFQGEDTVTGFWFAAFASPGEPIESETDMSIDYFYIIRSEQSTIGRDGAGERVMRGDVNGDDEVDSTDARLVLQLAVGKITALAVQSAADVNGDGKADSTDARLILQLAVGKISAFPAA